MGPCLQPLFHGPEEQGPVPSDHCQLSSWTLTPLPQQDRHGQGQGHPDSPGPYPHLHTRGSELCPVELERPPNPPNTPGPQKQWPGEEGRWVSQSPGQRRGWTGSGSLVSLGGEDMAWQNPPASLRTQPSPGPVGEKHSLLPCLHGDTAAQREVESMGQTSQGSNVSSSTHQPKTLTCHLNLLCLSFLICETVKKSVHFLGLFRG